MTQSKEQTPKTYAEIIMDDLSIHLMRKAVKTSKQRRGSNS